MAQWAGFRGILFSLSLFLSAAGDHRAGRPVGAREQLSLPLSLMVPEDRGSAGDSSSTFISSIPSTSIKATRSIAANGASDLYETADAAGAAVQRCSAVGHCYPVGGCTWPMDAAFMAYTAAEWSGLVDSPAPSYLENLWSTVSDEKGQLVIGLLTAGWRQLRLADLASVQCFLRLQSDDPADQQASLPLMAPEAGEPLIFNATLDEQTEECLYTDPATVAASYNFGSWMAGLVTLRLNAALASARSAMGAFMYGNLLSAVVVPSGPLLDLPCDCHTVQEYLDAADAYVSGSSTSGSWGTGVGVLGSLAGFGLVDGPTSGSQLTMCLPRVSDAISTAYWRGQCTSSTNEVIWEPFLCAQKAAWAPYPPSAPAVPAPPLTPEPPPPIVPTCHRTCYPEVFAFSTCPFRLYTTYQLANAASNASLSILLGNMWSRIAPSGMLTFGSDPDTPGAPSFIFMDARALQCFMLIQLDVAPPDDVYGMPLRDEVIVASGPIDNMAPGGCSFTEPLAAYGEWVSHMLALKVNMLLAPHMSYVPNSGPSLAAAVFSQAVGGPCACLSVQEVVQRAEAAVSSTITQVTATDPVWTYSECARDAALAYNSGVCPARRTFPKHLCRPNDLRPLLPAQPPLQSLSPLRPSPPPPPPPPSPSPLLTPPPPLPPPLSLPPPPPYPLPPPVPLPLSPTLPPRPPPPYPLRPSEPAPSPPRLPPQPPPPAYPLTPSVPPPSPQPPSPPLPPPNPLTPSSPLTSRLPPTPRSAIANSPPDIPRTVPTVCDASCVPPSEPCPFFMYGIDDWADVTVASLAALDLASYWSFFAEFDDDLYIFGSPTGPRIEFQDLASLQCFMIMQRNRSAVLMPNGQPADPPPVPPRQLLLRLVIGFSATVDSQNRCVLDTEVDHLKYFGPWLADAIVLKLNVQYSRLHAPKAALEQQQEQEWPLQLHEARFSSAWPDGAGDPPIPLCMCRSVADVVTWAERYIGRHDMSLRDATAAAACGAALLEVYGKGVCSSGSGPAMLCPGPQDPYEDLPPQLAETSRPPPSPNQDPPAPTPLPPKPNATHPPRPPSPRPPKPRGPRPPSPRPPRRPSPRPPKPPSPRLPLPTSPTQRPKPPPLPSPQLAKPPKPPRPPQPRSPSPKPPRRPSPRPPQPRPPRRPRPPSPRPPRPLRPRPPSPKASGPVRPSPRANSPHSPRPPIPTGLSCSSACIGPGTPCPFMVVGMGGWADTRRNHTVVGTLTSYWSFFTGGRPDAAYVFGHDEGHQLQFPDLTSLQCFLRMQYNRSSVLVPLSDGRGANPAAPAPTSSQAPMPLVQSVQFKATSNSAFQCVLQSAAGLELYYGPWLADVIVLKLNVQLSRLTARLGSGSAADGRVSFHDTIFTHTSATSVNADVSACACRHVVDVANDAEAFVGGGGGATRVQLQDAVNAGSCGKALAVVYGARVCGNIPPVGPPLLCRPATATASANLAR